MKIVKLLIVLILFSLQVNATGYSHNMFVAHKKLQTGKEYREVKERVTRQSPAKTVVNKTVIIQSGQSAISYTKSIATKVSNKMVTLNERVLEEGPKSFFETEEEEKINHSIATKLAGLIKDIIYTFIGSSSISK